MRDGPAAVAFVSGTAAVTPTPTFAYVVANAVSNILCRLLQLLQLPAC